MSGDPGGWSGWSATCCSDRATAFLASERVRLGRDVETKMIDGRLHYRERRPGNRYEWTGDDAAFAGRVDAALTGLAIPLDDLDEWRECCRRWGPRSRSALGCLLGFVRVAWGDPNANVSNMEGYDGRTWVTWARPPGVESANEQDAATEELALLAALEAAPR